MITSTATSVTPTSATLNGNITLNDGETIMKKGFVYSTSNTNPEINGADVLKVSSSAGTGVFSENITDLIPSTVYYFKAYAKNSIGTTYGNTQTFTTSASLGNEDFENTYFSVLPNPAMDILYIKNANNIEVKRVKIFNILGKLIYDRRNKNNQIDFFGFSKSVYFLKLIDQKGRISIKKIIKK